MSLWTCLDCLTRFAVGLSRCPHCDSTDYSEDELPKTTVSNGGSNARAELEPGYVAPERGEQSSAGTSSSASAGTSEANTSTGLNESQSPAPLTENPSPKPRRKPADVSPSAASTDGSTPATGTDQPPADVNSTGSMRLPKPGVSNDGE